MIHDALLEKSTPFVSSQVKGSAIQKPEICYTPRGNWPLKHVGVYSEWWLMSWCLSSGPRGL